jgi:predicted lipoprotein with Yx(FWY)xxD motif
MRRRRFPALLPALVPALVLLAACNANSGTGDGTGTAATTDPSTGDRVISTPSSPAPTASASGGSGEIEIETEDSQLGTILTDSEGRTLYVFLQDRGSESTCLDDCAAAWPPLTTAGEVTAGDGVQGKLGASARPDGTTQVTIAGRPLYTFAEDTSPGDVNGQGLADAWYVVSPTGRPIKR